MAKNSRQRPGDAARNPVTPLVPGALPRAVAYSKRAAGRAGDTGRPHSRSHLERTAPVQGPRGARGRGGRGRGGRRVRRVRVPVRGQRAQPGLLRGARGLAAGQRDHARGRAARGARLRPGRGGRRLAGLVGGVRRGPHAVRGGHLLGGRRARGLRERAGDEPRPPRRPVVRPDARPAGAGDLPAPPAVRRRRDQAARAARPRRPDHHRCRRRPRGLHPGGAHQQRHDQAVPAGRPVRPGVLPGQPGADRRGGALVHRERLVMTRRPARPGARPAGARRPGDPAGRTRKPLPLWDRLKFLVLLALVWLVLVWSEMASFPIMSFTDAARDQVRKGLWVIALAGLEALRQVNYLVQEHWGGYHQLWTRGIFGSVERAGRRLSDWTRFRMARAAKWLIALVIAALILGKAYHTTPWNGLFLLPGTILRALPLIIYVTAIVSLGILQFVAIFWYMSKGGVDVYYPDDIKTRFSDVWGQDHVLERVKENMVYLEDPESIEEHGGYVPGGILLWGPPGTGKTLMAEAVAGETGKPFVFVDPGAFINMFFGVGILKVKSLFRRLRRLAVRYGGVIVFFDEADSLGNRGAGVGTGGPAGFGPVSPHAACHGFSYLSEDTRSALFARAIRDARQAAPAPRPGGRFRQMLPVYGGGGGMGTLQALLTEMSGLKKPRGFLNRVVRRTLGMRPKPPPKYRILIMMATNMPSALDEALLRPGRIDRVYRVGYPSKEGRKRTYQGYLAKVAHEITDEQVDHLATITPYATGATIKDLVNEALIVALRDGRTTITWNDVLRAKLLKSVGPSEGVEYVERERHAVAIHEACHAVISHLVQKRNVIDTATIEKGSDYLGFVKPIPIEEQFTSWRGEYEADIMVSLASLVGERMFFDGDSSSGVSGDLQNATTIALAMEGLWGMGGQFGSHAVTRAPAGAHPVADGNDRNVLETGLGRRAEARLAELAERTSAMLAKHRAAVLSVAHALESHKTISGEDVVAVIEGTQGPLVDGRPYADPGFTAELEAYHQQVLAVHRSHDRTTPLPVPVPRRGLPAAADLWPAGAGGGAATWSDTVGLRDPEAEDDTEPGSAQPR